MFLLFGGEIYYPYGGWEDFQGAYGSLELARAAVEKADVRWWHIVDVSAGKIVEDGLKGRS